ncbi:MAG: hypothetical protein J6Y37_11555 [Paludibacteraceae bacterium]|nr:hypothetical protein [Paludibacteraceae bacterium]
MSRKSTREVRESVRNEVAASYKMRIRSLEGDLHDMRSRLHASLNESAGLRDENLRLKSELELLRDWNRRLLDFADMPDGEREVAFRRYVDGLERDERYERMLSGFTSLFNLF